MLHMSIPGVWTEWVVCWGVSEGVMANLDPFDWSELGAWCLYVSGISCAKSELTAGDPV